MKVLLIGGLIIAGLVWGSTASMAQSTAPSATAPSATTGVSQAGAAIGEPGKAAAARTEKQKALEEQTDRLFAMATDLKAQVDKTNRNILSLTVVRKAEEIEALAKKMKDQAKK